MKRILICFLLCAPALLFAQSHKTGNLTIFSEDGDKFYLLLNGEKQNSTPQANLRVEDLSQPFYNAKIIFADSTLAPVSKNNLMIEGVDNVMMDVVYKIKKDKTGKSKLNYFSSVEAKNNYIPPAGVYVYHYGQPAMVQVSNGTTLTTTTTTYGDGVSASMNVNGMGVSMNVSVSEPVMQTTTTTVTTSESNSNLDNTRNNGCNGFPMSPSNFNAAVKTIEGSSFDETRLSTAKTIASKNCLSTDQVVTICKLLSFEENRLEFAKHAYRYTTDKNNYFKVGEVFSFSSNKEELNKFIADN